MILCELQVVWVGDGCREIGIWPKSVQEDWLMILCELEVDAHDRLTEAMVLEHRLQPR